MKKRTPKPPGLSPHDHKLWQRVTKTVSPLKKREAKADPEADDASWHAWLADNGFVDAEPAATPITHQAASALAKEPSPAKSAKPTLKPKDTFKPSLAPKSVRELERPTHRKLAKGRLPIDATLDLHNLTQEQAHRMLLSFLSESRQRGRRHLLVITGKGSSQNSQGVLRTMLPIWISTPPLNQLVSGLKQASRDHGGEGAFYIRLKKQKGPSR
ncbi:MAG: Smr/MutS family protein [Pseudomonadota bacterium]